MIQILNKSMKMTRNQFKRVLGVTVVVKNIFRCGVGSLDISRSRISILIIIIVYSLFQALCLVLSFMVLIFSVLSEGVHGGIINVYEVYSVDYLISAWGL